jgi:hypothetical protein
VAAPRATREREVFEREAPARAEAAREALDDDV